MANMLERKAGALNGLIIVGSCVLGAFEATRPWASALRFSWSRADLFRLGQLLRLVPDPGASRFEATKPASFRIGGRDAYIKGVNDHYSVQIHDATTRANESVSEAERKQHFDRAKALRAEHRQMIDEAKHAVY